MSVLFIVWAIILGLCFGSFINAALYRMAKNESLIKGRSHCPDCKATLKFSDLIPIISFLHLKGKCRYCEKKIDFQYLLIELATGILFGCAALIWWQRFGFFPPDGLILIRDLIAVCLLIFLFVFDFRHYLLPDKVTLPAIIVFFAINLIIGFSLGSLLLAVAVGAGFFALQYFISKGRWVGGGDIRFGALMGALLGWPTVLVGLFIAYVLGGAIAVGLLSSGKKKWGAKLPFGTFLAVASLFALWWGEPLLKWYFHLFTL